jgi:hypothetical protein
MSKEVELLSELLGEVQDPEYRVYQLFLKTIQATGMLIQSPRLDSILSHKINPTWAELLNEHSMTVYDSWNLGPRSSIKKPLLVDSEIYELSLIVNKETICLGKKTLKEWRQRITQEGLGEKNNFIASIHKKHFETIKTNPFVIKIKLITLDPKLRSEAEQKLFLNPNPQTYLHHLLEKTLSDYSSILKGERAKLFAAPKFKTLEQTREYLLNQHFNAFGLKNVIHIRYVLDNLKDRLLTNEELITDVPANVLLQQENLLYLQTCLELQIPFSGR